MDFLHADKEGVRIGASSSAAKELAKDRILTLCTSSQVELRCQYRGKVVNTTNDGVVVNFLPETEGLIPVSALTWSRQIDYEEFYKPGMFVRVTPIIIDDQGNVTLGD